MRDRTPGGHRRGPAARVRPVVPCATPGPGGRLRLGTKGPRGATGRRAGRREPSRPGLTFAAARLLSSWSRRAAGSRSQTPSRGPMVARPGRRGPAADGGGRRPGSWGRRRAAHSRRAGTRARRTVPGAAARGGDLSATKRAPQFVGAAPPLSGAGRAAPQRGRTLRRG